MADPVSSRTLARDDRTVYRHRLSTRIWHWVNAAAIFTLLMSGLMIFNAHPRLYWGKYGANSDPAWLEISSTASTGTLRIGALHIPTTGVLGLWRDRQGAVQHRAFPHWATLPAHYDLAGARRWHLAVAWVLGFGALFAWIWGFVNRHTQRDLLPERRELSGAVIWQDIKDHARLRLPTGDAAARYNILQKLAYLLVIFALLPVLIGTGLTLSPGMNAAWPWLLELFGGRQSARSIHFIAATLMVLFILVHLVMVLLAGPFNEVRSMITGRLRLPPERMQR